MMDLFKAAPKPSTIVIHEWHDQPQTGSDNGRFWALDATKDESNGKVALIPTLLSKQFKGTRNLTATSETNFAPLLTYDASSDHIEAHTTVPGDNIDAEFNRLGPGIRLAQTQTINKLFTGKLPGTPDSQRLLFPAAVLPDPQPPQDDDTSCPHTLVVMAVDSGKGSFDLKYRLRQVQSHKKPLLSLQEAYSSYEQTLRLASDSEAPDTSPTDLVQLNISSIGQKPEYLLLTTLSTGKDGGQSLLSLYTVDQNLVFSEASSITEPNQDRGVRWQLQTFQLPAHVTKIAPIVLETTAAKYLVVFYFNKGALRCTSLQYTGSGAFIGPVNDYPCIVGTAKERNASVQQPPTTITSPTRFSLPSYMSFTAEQTPMQAQEQIRQAAYKQSQMMAGEEAQPYTMMANKSVWIFYEGRDGHAKYVRHELPTDIAGLYDGWLAASWRVGPSPNEMDDLSKKVDSPTASEADTSAVKSVNKAAKTVENATKPDDGAPADTETVSKPEDDPSANGASLPKKEEKTDEGDENTRKTKGETPPKEDDSSKSSGRPSTDTIDYSVGRHFIPVAVATDFLSMQ